MNIGQLRQALSGLDDQMDITVEFFDKNGDDHYVGGLSSANVEFGCEEFPTLVLTGNSEEPRDEEWPKQYFASLEKKE